LSIQLLSCSCTSRRGLPAAQAGSTAPSLRAAAALLGPAAVSAQAAAPGHAPSLEPVTIPDTFPLQPTRRRGKTPISTRGIGSSAADRHRRAVGQAVLWVPTAPWLRFPAGKLGKRLTATKLNSVHRADVSAVPANPTGQPGKSICGAKLL